jgi:hypothetical protein
MDGQQQFMRAELQFNKYYSNYIYLIIDKGRDIKDRNVWAKIKHIKEPL